MASACYPLQHASKCLHQRIKLHDGLAHPTSKSPRNDFDLFMEPLVEELQQLWRGVLTRDIYSSPPADLFLRAVIIWFIHDYPALGTMLGRTTHSYNACVRCDRNPLSYAILSKICYIGHRRFLARRSRVLQNTEDMYSMQSMKPVMRQRVSLPISCKWN